MKFKIILLIFVSILFLSLVGICEEEKIYLVNLTIDNYQEEFLECEVPVVVYFWASWCKPCKLMSPIMERLNIFYKGKVKFLKVNVDKNRKLLNDFRPLQGLPLSIFYKIDKLENKPKEVIRVLGFMPFIAINNYIIPLLKKEKKEKKEKDDCSGGVCDPPEGE